MTTRTATPPLDAPAPPTHDAVIERELRAILATQDESVTREARDSLWGLALSGGGIRSATFALGLLQSLARSRAIGGFHYLSTVSGGGYAGAFLQGAMRRFGLEGASDLLTASVDDDGERLGTPPGVRMRANRPLRHLREYSNYLSPRKAAVSGDTLGMIATYLRNVLLTQSQLIVLMLALGLLPLVLYPWMHALAAQPRLALSLAGLLAVLASVALAFVSSHAQRHAQSSDNEAPRTDIAMVSAGVVALLGAASALGALGVFSTEAPPPMFDRSLCAAFGLGVPGDCARYDLGLFAAAGYFGVWVAWLLMDLVLSAWRGTSSLLRRHWPRFLLGSFGAALLAGGLVLLLHRIGRALQLQPWESLIWGTPLVLGAVTGAAAIHIGLIGPALSDLQREVWARVGGKAGALVLLGICGSVALLVIGPWLLGHLLWAGGGGWTERIAGWGGVASWLGVSLSGVFAAARSGQTRGNARAPGPLRRWLMTLAPWVFVLGLWIGIGLLAQWLLGEILDSSVPAQAHAGDFDAYLDALSTQLRVHDGTVALMLLASLVLGALLSFAMDANELSLNAFYRNRLVRCYLGATNTLRNPEPVTNFDPRDDIALHDLEHARDAATGEPRPRPLYPLIGATMNLVSAKQLDWQDRRAASFVLSPGYCGHLPPRGRTGAEPAGDRTVAPDPRALAHTLELGTAIAVSGAAVSPNMGVRSSPAITFLLTLFDARLGWWLPNRMHQRIPSDRPRLPGLHLVAELLGLTHGTGRFAHVSDGGHFENLGIYELVRRGCRFILCSDAGADPQREFADLGNAIQKCRVDFGVEIEIDVADLRPDPVTGLSRRHATLGRIRYPDGGDGDAGNEGLLLYLKPSLLGDESADIQHYARMHPQFPHEPTSDQYFDEAQFECYRRLGQHVGSRVVERMMARIDDAHVRNPLTLQNSDAKERLLKEMAHQLYEPVDAIGRNFSRHSEAMSRLFGTLRGTPALAVLDAQIYPGWINAHPPADAARIDVHAALPAAENFRACFYFCQELIQLMESVYIDLDLEANWNHPDNRGWMNVFRHWSWAPVFRVAWALSAQTYGARFVDFCESRIGIPRIVDALKVVKHARGEGETPVDFARRLREAGEINFAEAGILTSSALEGGADVHAVYRLALRWKWILGRDDGGLRDLGFGIAVFRADDLVLFRIQDHVRRLGLGAEFMRLLLAQQKVREVALRAGHYGVVGVLSDGARRELERDLRRMHRDALLRRRGETRAANGATTAG